jgi:hypothetical protein
MTTALRIVSGVLRYSDERGHQVNVVIEQEHEGREALVKIETDKSFDAASWPTIRDGIDRLLEALPSHNERYRS